MKSMILFSFLFCCLGGYSRQNSNGRYSEYKKTANNTYQVFHYSDNDITVANVIDPFDGLKSEHEWKERYRITKGQGNIYQTLVNCIGTYLKTAIEDEEDDFSVFLKHDLNGKLQYVDFTYPSKYDIPIEGIERLETALKAGIILTVVPISPKRLDGVYYITTIRSFSMKEIQSDAFPPPPTSADPPSGSEQMDNSLCYAFTLYVMQH